MNRLHVSLLGQPPTIEPTPLTRRIPPLPASATYLQAVDWNRVLHVARRHVKRFAELQAKVLKNNNPKAIHDFRVVTRRLQQLLDLLYPKPRPKRIRKLRRTIQRSRRLFSRVRNCDVLILRVDSYLARKETAHRESWAEFKVYLEHQRSKSFEKAAAKLSEFNRAEILAGLRNAINSVPPDGARTQPPVHESFQTRFTAELDSLWKVFFGYVAKSRTASSPGALHRVRIAGKRLRYLLEVIAESGVPQTEQMLATLRGIHQTLGEWQDLQVMEEMISEMQQQPKLLASNTSLAGEIEQLRRQSQRVQQKYAKNYYSAIESSAWSELQIWITSLLTKRPPARVKHQIKPRVLNRA